MLKNAELERGSPRLVIIYKPLNTVLEWIRYPIPNKRDLIKRLDKAVVFSKFDMKSGFWQIQIHESDRYKTAFVTPFGHYEWNVMPFGLKNAPSYGGILKQKSGSDSSEQIVRFHSEYLRGSENSIPDFLTREFLQDKQWLDHPKTSKNESQSSSLILQKLFITLFTFTKFYILSLGVLVLMSSEPFLLSINIIMQTMLKPDRAARFSQQLLIRASQMHDDDAESETSSSCQPAQPLLSALPVALAHIQDRLYLHSEMISVEEDEG
ncbi:hypothetical protein Prudu_1477S000200 [Prunus dulcis]|uniref:Reverse transcriptase domain-containing protein n=1 Tax=Prunus dulcis TaxID=3755 RepID=A0A5H2XV84_PRUDU|nr:hypothetical protein Prudu_1477S000200 [Prunus dulcis]